MGILSMIAASASRVMGSDRRRSGGFGYGFASYSMLQIDSPRCRQNFGNANEIVGGGGEDEEPFDQRPSAMAGLAQPTDRLDPVQRFCAPLHLLQAAAVTGVEGRGAS